jgi:PAS domain S-box-containing protein
MAAPDLTAFLPGRLEMRPAGKFESASFNLFQAIVEQAPDAIIVAGRDGAIKVWNRGAETIFGYAAAEVLGKSLDVIIPERLRAAHWEGFHRAIDTGRTKHGNRVLTTRSIHKNGSRLYVDLSFGLLRDEAGAVTGAMAVGRDGTARYLADGALRARIAELEGKINTGS